MRAPAARLRAYQQQYDVLRCRLARIGYIAVGTITVSRLTCGRPTCRCHREPRYRHGPYYYWTTKVKGRTVTKLLTQEEAELYMQWIENRRELEVTVKKMLRLSRAVAVVVLKERFFRENRG